MTEQTAPDITTGFIQMVEAFKLKPELEGKIKELEQSMDHANYTLSDRERRISELEARLASASADKERLTRERDEAMFRSLELEEKTNAVSDLVAKLEGLVRPEPVAKVEAPAPVSEPAKDVEQEKPYFSGPYGSGDEHGNREGIDTTDQYHTQSQAYDLHEHHPEYSGHEAEQQRSEEGKSEAPNWNTPTKSEQNASEQSMGHSDVSEIRPEPRPNEGIPYDQKPYWVSDANWKAEGGQGPYDNGSWEAPWERWRA